MIMCLYVCIKNDYVFVNVNSPGISQFLYSTQQFYYCQQLMLSLRVTEWSSVYIIVPQNWIFVYTGLSSLQFLV